MRTLQQDGDLKLSVTLSDERWLIYSKKFFRWRNLSIERILLLGSVSYNSFIRYVYQKEVR